MELGRVTPPQGGGGEYVMVAYVSTSSEHLERMRGLNNRFNELETISQKLSNEEHKGAICWLELKDILTRMSLFEKFVICAAFFLAEEKKGKKAEEGELVYMVTQGVVGETYQRAHEAPFESPNKPRFTIINLLERLHPTHRGHKLSMYFFSHFDFSQITPLLGIPEGEYPFGYGNILDTNKSSLSRVSMIEGGGENEGEKDGEKGEAIQPFHLYGGHFIFLIPPPLSSTPLPPPPGFTFQKLDDGVSVKKYRNFFGKTQFSAVDPLVSLKRTGKFLGCFESVLGPFSIVVFAVLGDWVRVKYSSSSSSSSFSSSSSSLTTKANNDSVIMVTGFQFWCDDLPLYREDLLPSPSSSHSFRLLVQFFLLSLSREFNQALVVDVDRVSSGKIFLSQLGKMAAGSAYEFYDTYLQPEVPSVSKNWLSKYLDPLPASTLLYFEPPMSYDAKL